MKPSAYHNCLALHIRMAEGERLLPDKPSRLLRILWLIFVPLFLSLAAMVWGLDAVRLMVSP